MDTYYFNADDEDDDGGLYRKLPEVPREVKATGRSKCKRSNAKEEKKRNECMGTVTQILHTAYTMLGEIITPYIQSRRPNNAL